MKIFRSVRYELRARRSSDDAAKLENLNSPEDHQKWTFLTLAFTIGDEIITDYILKTKILLKTVLLNETFVVCKEEQHQSLHYSI